MRESRPYGSVRGARDETRVPTASVGDVCVWHESEVPAPVVYVGYREKIGKHLLRRR